MIRLAKKDDARAGDEAREEPDATAARAADSATKEGTAGGDGGVEGGFGHSG